LQAGGHRFDSDILHKGRSKEERRKNREERREKTDRKGLLGRVGIADR
jgi:hypothetical protein